MPNAERRASVIFATRVGHPGGKVLGVHRWMTVLQVSSKRKCLCKGVVLFFYEIEVIKVVHFLKTSSSYAIA